LGGTTGLGELDALEDPAVQENDDRRFRFIEKGKRQVEEIAQKGPGPKSPEKKSPGYGARFLGVGGCQMSH